MSLAGAFTRRVRGVRVVNLWALGVLLVLVFALYLVKTFADSERIDIGDTETQIAQEQRRIVLLRAEVAFLERPQRIERLAVQGLHAQPISGDQEADLGALPQIARVATGSGDAPPPEAPK